MQLDYYWDFTCWVVLGHKVREQHWHQLVRPPVCQSAVAAFPVNLGNSPSQTQPATSVIAYRLLANTANAEMFTGIVSVSLARHPHPPLL